jgi:hypothetical protein
MKQHELDEIVQQANECHRKTVANKDSWLVVPKDKEEEALGLVDALDCRSEDEDWTNSALPQELEILSQLPEHQRQAVFEAAGKQNHCQNLWEWLNYLKNYVDGYIRLNEAK